MTLVTGEVQATIDAMEISVLEVEEARSMPAAAYTSEAFYEFEKEAVFYRTWVWLGHQNQIPDPGDYFAITIADEPLLVVRQADGEILVMSAVCRHRGHPIAHGEGEREGNCSRFRCPYHSWTYGLDGRLMAAPSMDRTVDSAALRAETRLPRLRVELFHGLIFANFDADAAPLAPTLGKLDRELTTFGLADMVVMPQILETDLAWNWKIMHENGIEPYHTDFVHKGYHDMAPSRNSIFFDWDDGDGQIMHPTYFTKKDGGFNPRHTAPFPPIPTLTDDQRERVIFGSVPPTLFYCLMPDQIFTFLILPQATNRMALGLNFYYPRSTRQMATFDWAYQGQAAATDIFGVQDERTNAALQRGLGSRFAPRGRYCYLEATLPQFNRWLLARYRGYAGAETRMAAE